MNWAAQAVRSRYSMRKPLHKPDGTARGAGSIAALWAGHDSQRLGWAFRAYERFVASLSPEIRERLTHKGQQEEAYVVVFGKTQVGKTTLLLDLMGIEPTSLERVSRVLRGGRAQGQSATATTMEYRRSTDLRWGLRINDQVIRWFDDDGGITEALGQVRTAMEARQLIGQAPSIVHIPIDCFTSHNGQPGVRMLDLPGDKPANPTEQEHVQEMARKYVPLADLILLVGKGDDLSFLQPGGLPLPGIEDWQSVPGRFRIVTTFSFTSQSVRALVRQHDGPTDAGFFRQRLIEQIEKFGHLGDDARQPERYFPLEFGATWLNVQQRDPELYARISPMIETLKGQLHADILASTTPLARLRNAVQARVVIARVKENRLKELEVATGNIRQQLESAKADQKQARKAARRLQKVCESHTQSLAVIKIGRIRQDLKHHFNLSGSTPDGNPDESVSGFKILVREAKASLKQRLADSRPDSAELADTAWFWRDVKANIDRQQTDKIIDDLFSFFLKKLNGYWFPIDAYLRTGSGSDYEQDCKSLKSCINDASKQLTELARETWLTAAEQQLRLHQENARAACRKHRYWKQMAEDMARPIASLEQELAAHELEDRVFRHRMDKDLQESHRFIEMLDTEYLAELQNRRKAMLSERRSIPAFLDLLAAVHMTQARKQLLLHIEPARSS